MMLDGDKTKRIKADFFIELYAVRNDRLVNSFDWYTKDRFTKAMLERYKAKKLKAVTDFRIIKQHINNAGKAGKKAAISSRLRKFTEDQELTIDSLAIESASAAAEAKKVWKSAETLKTQISSLDVESCIGEEAMWNSLQELLTPIRGKLRDAGIRIKQ
jgi:DNA helicase IV